MDLSFFLLAGGPAQISDNDDSIVVHVLLWRVRVSLRVGKHLDKQLLVEIVGSSGSSVCRALAKAWMNEY